MVLLSVLLCLWLVVHWQIYGGQGRGVFLWRLSVLHHWSCYWSTRPWFFNGDGYTGTSLSSPELFLWFSVHETYAPTILLRRAKTLRKETGNDSYVTQQEVDRRPLGETLQVCLLRLFQLLFGELIISLISLYMSVLYGLLYMFFVAYPIVYEQEKGYSACITGLVFIPSPLGSSCPPRALHPSINTILSSHLAEIRVIPMMVSCWAIPIDLSIFARTSYPRLDRLLLGFHVGFGFIFLYITTRQITISLTRTEYQKLATSALAAKTFLRSMWGGCTVLFTNQMYARLAYEWATTLLAFIALARCTSWELRSASTRNSPQTMRLYLQTPPATLRSTVTTCIAYLSKR